MNGDMVGRFDNETDPTALECGPIKTGRIVGVNHTGLSGLSQLVIERLDGSMEVVHIEAGYGIRAVVAAFGGLHQAYGKFIDYSTDCLGVMEGFSPCFEDEDDDGEEVDFYD